MKAENLKVWRQKVLERDNHTCQICGNPGNIGDHIKSRKEFPELALETDNGRCLCWWCHPHYGNKSRAQPPKPRRKHPQGTIGIIKLGYSLVVPLPKEFIKRWNIQEGNTIPYIYNKSALWFIPMETT